MHNVVILGGGRRPAWVSCGWADTRGDREIQGRDHVLSMEDPNAGRGGRSSFLGGFVEDIGDRNVSAVTVSSTWADCGVVAEAIEDLTAQRALCGENQSWAKMRLSRGRCESKQIIKNLLDTPTQDSNTRER